MSTPKKPTKRPPREVETEIEIPPATELETLPAETAHPVAPSTPPEWLDPNIPR